jgi:DNA-binding CsgD family transcriptional regulator/PAS domain-containing protein
LAARRAVIRPISLASLLIVLLGGAKAMTVSISHQDLSDLIGRIYDCTLDPSRWEATLDAIRSLLRCPTAQLALVDLRQHRVLIQKTLGMEAQMIEAVNKHMPEITQFIEGHLDNGLSMDGPLVVSRMGPPYLSPHYWETVRLGGFVDFAQTILMRTPTRMSALGFGRHESVGVLGDREIEILRLLIPHVRRAVTISNVLDVQVIEKARMAETLDALKLGVVLANEDSRILHVNRAADEMMRNGGPLRDHGGVLRAEGGAASVEIRSAIKQAAGHESCIGKTGLAVRLTEENETPVVAHVLPLAGGEVRSRLEPAAVAAVFVNPKVDDAASAQAVAASYGLTPAETRVLTRMLTGSTVAEAAVDLGVATTTARTHLDNIFAKTGVSRQSGLIRLAAQLAPSVAT